MIWLQSILERALSLTIGKVLLLVCVGLVAACGQKGPLYLTAPKATASPSQPLPGNADGDAGAPATGEPKPQR